MKTKNTIILFILITMAACGGGGGGGSTLVSEVLDTIAPRITGPSGAAGSESSEIEVNENSSTVFDFSANEGVTWTVLGDDASLFSINSNGVLVFNSAPDYENLTVTSYTVTITARDSSGNSSSQVVTIYVNDIFDQPYSESILSGMRTTYPTYTYITNPIRLGPVNDNRQLTYDGETSFFYSIPNCGYSRACVNFDLAGTATIGDAEWTSDYTPAVFDAAGEVESLLLPSLFINNFEGQSDFHYSQAEWNTFNVGSYEEIDIFEAFGYEITDGYEFKLLELESLDNETIGVISHWNYHYFGIWESVDPNLTEVSAITPFVYGVDRSSFASRPLGRAEYGGYMLGTIAYQSSSVAPTYIGAIPGIFDLEVNFDDLNGNFEFQWLASSNDLVSYYDGETVLDNLAVDNALALGGLIPVSLFSIQSGDIAYSGSVTNDYVCASGQCTWMNFSVYGTFFGEYSETAGRITQWGGSSNSNQFYITGVFGGVNLQDVTLTEIQ